ncbi:hypothetical protein ACTXGU_00025 [Niallia sp. 01092]|uniref:hypothetical protein n=1 Tax=Niallia sp. 01092 TaxID=3457759 RepID=UPI003FCF61F1
MDHAISSLQPYLECELDELTEEWQSKKYKKLSDFPSYPPAKALVDAIHRLEKYYYGEFKTMSLKEEMKWREGF